MKLGLVTYNLAKDWDIPTIIERCQATGFEGVELRTTHAHDVEPSLGHEQRRDVRTRFADSGITLWGLGTTCEYHSADASQVRANIDVTRQFVELAAEVGARGVKVRPNGFPRDAAVAREQTLEQIGLALAECGRFAAGAGVEIWLEAHGSGTCEVPCVQRILDVAAHPSVLACWNSNLTDVIDGSVAANFARLRGRIGSVHITELYRHNYPWRELFHLLQASGYQGYALAETASSPDAEAVMRYYRRLWEELSRAG